MDQIQFVLASKSSFCVQDFLKIDAGYGIGLKLFPINTPITYLPMKDRTRPGEQPLRALALCD